jgi:hypothetical protein
VYSWLGTTETRNGTGAAAESKQKELSLVVRNDWDGNGESGKAAMSLQARKEKSLRKCGVAH